VFVVASARDDFDPTAVLFEFDGVRRDIAPSRETGKTIAHCVTNGPPFSRTGNERVEAEAMLVMPVCGQNGQDIAGTITAGFGGSKMGGPEVDAGLYIPISIHPVGSLCARTGQSISVQDADQGHLMAVAYSFDSLSSNSMKSSNPNSGCGIVNIARSLDTSRGLDPSCNQGGIGIIQKAYFIREDAKANTFGATPLEVSTCVTSLVPSVQSHAVFQPIALQDVTPREKAQNGRGWNDDGTAYTVDTHATQGVAHPMVLMDQGGSVMNVEHDMVGTLRRESHGHEPVVMQPLVAMRESGLGYWMEDTVAGTLDANMGMSGHANRPAVMTVPQAMAVRRLTPVECERLQGFPDNYTNIPWRKKDESPDGPRYKALGNSWAVPNVRWIGKRIQEALNAIH
jgi:DNA (cytosine-5)-methyltransferase 1